MSSIRHFINTDLLKKASFFNQLTMDLNSLLPAPLIGYCYVIGLSNTELTISVNSSMRASKLRFYKSEILKNMNKIHNLKLHSLKISILPKAIQLQETPPIKKTLSTSSAEQVKSLAMTMTYGSLRKSLLKLSGHSSNKNSIYKEAKNLKNR